jgi:hypothetical protein
MGWNNRVGIVVVGLIGKVTTDLIANLAASHHTCIHVYDIKHTIVYYACVYAPIVFNRLIK